MTADHHGTSPGPPKRWEMLLRVVGGAYGEQAAGDLAQEYREHVLPTCGVREAQRWYAAQALRSFGPVLAIRWRRRLPTQRASLAHRKGASMGQMIRDMQYALRTLGRSRGFSTVVVTTLALGVGSNTAVFSVINGVLLRPLPYADPESLVRVREWRNGEFGNVSPQDFLDLRAESQALSAAAAFTAVGAVTWNGTGRPTRVRRSRVSAGFFSLLGERALHGRTFARGEDVPGTEDVVVLSHGFWLREFGGQPDALGTVVTLDDRPHTVIGVLPRHFGFVGHAPTDQAELWQPLKIGPQNGRGGHWLQAVARLAPGVELETAQAEVSALAARLEALYPESNTGHGLRLVPLREAYVGGARTALLVLLGAVTLVLLIACSNVANLLLARATTRRPELAIRTALGAGRGRLVRQLFAESLVLAAAGGGLGLALAVIATRALLALGPDLPRAGEIGLDPMVLIYCLVLSVVSAVVFGVAPTVTCVRGDVEASLRDGARGATGSRSGGRLQAGFVTVQVALTFVLLVGAGLLLKSFGRLAAVDPGLDPENVVTMEVVLPRSGYDTRERIGAFYRDFLRDVRALPGVTAAGAVNNIPFRYNSCDGFRLPDRPLPPPPERPCAHNQLVTPDYFRAMGIPMLEGREFATSDRPDSRAVIMVNRTFAERFWPGRSAIGEIVSYNRIEREIVGVAASVKRLGLGTEAEAEMMIPHAQEAWDPQMFVVVRTAAAPESIVGSVRAALAARDPTIPMGTVSTLRSMVAASIAIPRFRAVLLGVFAAVAVLLAVLGLYGVISYAVSRRTHEIGVRLALGASQSRVLRFFVGRGMAMTAVGILVGLAGALAVTRTLTGLLFNVSPTDLLTFTGMPLLLLGVALAAAYVPARRATRVDPVSALRQE